MILGVIAYIPFIIAVILSIPSLNATLFYGYPYVEWAFAAFYILAGFIWGDLHQAKFRKDSKNWDGKLPENVVADAWKRRLPFFFACGLVVILIFVLEITALINGYYPFTR